MDYYSKQISKLIEELSSLPGIGSKSAQRLAFHILNMPEERVERLADTILDARRNIRYCKTCYTLTDAEECPICSNSGRDHSTIMVVETPRDLAAYEKTGQYDGVYHVLHGAIFPDAWNRTGRYPPERIDAASAGRCERSDHCHKLQSGRRDDCHVYQQTDQTDRN